MHRLSTAFLLLLGSAGLVRAEEWPGWRGPRGDGTSTETGIPIRWSATENIAWKTPIPGKGHSSPAIWGDRIFVTSALETELKQLLLCLDRRNGQVLWTREQPFRKQKLIHKLNSHASGTPATDGKYVITTFHDAPDAVVCCWDFDGKLIWKKSPGEFYSKHGFCASPLLYKDLVIINGDQDHKAAYLVALDKSTGQEVWRAQRPGIRSYCPPVLFDVRGKPQIVISGSECVVAYDPDSGKEIWRIDGPTEQFVASLVQQGDVLFMTYGFPKRGVIGIDPTGSGNVTQTHILYNDSPGAGGYVPSPIAHGGYFYNVNDEGIGTCREGRTGELMWKERLGGHHSASPVSAGGYLYFPADDGTTTVLKAGPKYDVAARNQIGEEIFASLAISRGQIFLRGSRHLFCIGVKP